MFGLSSKTASVCISCQARVLCNRFLRLSLEQTQPEANFRRTLSTAVAKVEDDDDQYEHHTPVAHPSSSPISSPLSNHTSHREPRRRRRTRVWRPTPVAKLGVPALGKPAEVLVLQPREDLVSDIPEIPVADEHDNGPRVLDTLRDETTPLSPEQMRENLDQFGKPFKDKNRPLNIIEWKQLRTSILTGFTHTQLLDYIGHAEATAKSTEDEAGIEAAKQWSTSPTVRYVMRKSVESSKARAKVKRSAAAHIMRNIWKLPSEAKSDEDSARTLVPLAWHKIAVLLSQQQRPLTRVAETAGVKIDVYRNRNFLAVYGSKEAVNKAQQAITRLKSKIKMITISLPRSTIPESADEFMNQDAQLNEMARSRHVYLERKPSPSCWSVRLHYNEDEPQAAEAARRDILLAIRPPDQLPFISAWPRASEFRTWFAPHSAQKTTWSANEVQMGRWRYRPKQSTSTQADHQNTIPRKHIKTVRFDILASNLKTQFWKDSIVPRREFVAFLGQALFPQGKGKELRSILYHNNQEAGADPTVRTEIPYLVPFLSSCKPGLAVDDLDTNKSPLTSQPRFIHRLLFIPVETNSQAPPIEAVLTGPDPHSGLNQPLQIHTVSAILEERSNVLLLPNLIVDTKLLCRTKYDFFSPCQSSESHVHEVNRQLIDYLNLARGQQAPSFHPFVTLSVQNRFMDRWDISKTKRSHARPASSTEKPVMEKKSPSTATAHPQKVHKVHYMLACSESLDVVHFVHPGAKAKGLSFEHVQLHNEAGFAGQQLRVVGNGGLLDVADVGDQKVEEIIWAAYATALRLGSSTV